VALAFPLLTRHLPRSATAISVVRVRYPDGRGILRGVLEHVTAQGFAVDELATAAANGERSPPGGPGGTANGRRMVEVTLQVHGRGLVNELAAGLSEIPAGQAVVADDVQTAGE
jgi:putative Mg2+ transporter-C (MgtC) family protein